MYVSVRLREWSRCQCSLRLAQGRQVSGTAERPISNSRSEAETGLSKAKAMPEGNGNECPTDDRITMTATVYIAHHY